MYQRNTSNCTRFAAVGGPVSASTASSDATKGGAVKMEREVLNFTIYCIGIVAEALGRDAREVYGLMKKGNLIMGYIVPCFDVLHTFSRQYIIDDLTNLMHQKQLI